ncbi:3-hydroxyacyl-CoA dehydrogenase [Grosmannia clavigera kw1407]|uniref:3-hydroxyacyl-CoA dehydrogenase n=1 Tax=Grosmannia clavigera (strain kw1407 / UAMH 11150) TaxID=655863 RepID=F0XS39_GROCL|nr:3-hydroxyacyl-CoA dehydrogenase [Grosmannia clavigera kw1407]EFW99477.1 3-hydroxyacyl-CoA dehydrogenase [Grosmannia clavigera kw1407]
MDTLSSATPRNSVFDGLLAQCLLSLLFGTLSHILYYRHGFRNKQSLGILVYHLVLEVALATKLWLSHGFGRGSTMACAISTAYATGLFTSILIYRLLLHPLRSFPGPFAAKVSRLYWLYLQRNGHIHTEMRSIADQYGDIVRIAPNELLLTSLDAITQVYGLSTSCTKKNTGLYDSFEFRGEHNLDSIPQREQHRKRRAVWDHAMSPKMLKVYEVGMREVLEDWLAVLERQSTAKEAVNTRPYSALIPLDSMGKVGFSEEYYSVKAGKGNEVLELLHTVFKSILDMGEITWPYSIVKGLGLSRDLTRFEKLAIEIADKRDEASQSNSQTFDVGKADVLSGLLQDFHSKEPKAYFNRNIVYTDTQVILAGAVDTIASTLSFVWFHLAKDHRVQSKLRDELATWHNTSEQAEFASADLVKCAYLEAVINESMRVDSPTGINGGRSTPPEGISVDGVHIPGNVVVRVGTYLYHRDERYFRQAGDFIPERWTTRPELVLEKRAFIPFLVGHWHCVGKRFALQLIRLVLAYTTWHYEFGFAPGEDGTRIYRESRNNVVIESGKLELVFKRRD